MFKSIEELVVVNDTILHNLFVENIATKVLLSQKDVSETEVTLMFLEKMRVSDQVIFNVEKETRGQADDNLWFLLQSGRLTVSKHHEIFTKNEYRNSYYGTY